MRNLFCFYLHNIIFNFYIFFIVYWFTVKFFLNSIVDFIPDFIFLFHFSDNSSSFIKKDLHLVSSKIFAWLPLLEALYIKWLNFSIFFTTNRITFFTRNLVTCQYCINIYIIYQNWIFLILTLMFYEFHCEQTL